MLALNGEKDIHNNEHETVHHLGKDKIDVDISPIFSQSSTTDANLGDYAGIGYGQGETDLMYTILRPMVYFCLTAVVPVSVTSKVYFMRMEIVICSISTSKISMH